MHLIVLMREWFGDCTITWLTPADVKIYVRSYAPTRRHISTRRDFRLVDTTIYFVLLFSYVGVILKRITCICLTPLNILVALMGILKVFCI